MRKNTIAKLGLSVIALASTQAWSAGYEKSIMFGGRASGTAGIATPYVQGSEALYYNPAGLARDKDGHDVSLNVSPTMPKFKAPVVANDTTVTADSKTALPVALMYNQNITDSLGLGIGYYVSGGLKADYTGLSSGEYKSDLNISEIALGAGYKVTDSLKVGLAYRILMAKASFAVGPLALNNLSDTNYAGFKLGAQYKLNEKTFFGLSYRSAANFSAKGKESITGRADTDVTTHTVMPDAITVGAQYNMNESWNLMWEYVFTNYSRVKSLQYETATTTSFLEQHWKDQHNIRLAGEYLGFGLPVRFGYIWTSQVVPSDLARATFTPPGQAHTLTLGTGATVMDGLALNGGFEYTMASGNGATSTTSGVTTYLGKYSVDEFALHLGASYTF